MTASIVGSAPWAPAVPSTRSVRAFGLFHKHCAAPPSDTRHPLDPFAGRLDPRGQHSDEVGWETYEPHCPASRTSVGRGAVTQLYKR
jgi:hypothetical protein